jgi:hypothetical protein
MGVDLPLVVAALQRVLQFQLDLMLVVQRPEVEPVVSGGLAAAYEFLDLEAADGIPLAGLGQAGGAVTSALAEAATTSAPEQTPVLVEQRPLREGPTRCRPGQSGPAPSVQKPSMKGEGTQHFESADVATTAVFTSPEGGEFLPK